MTAPGDWILPSGRSVEHLLRTAGQLQSPTHPNFIYLDDRQIEALFSPAEWESIKSRLLPAPAMNPSLSSFVSGVFDVCNPSDGSTCR